MNYLAQYWPGWHSPASQTWLLSSFCQDWVSNTWSWLLSLLPVQTYSLRTAFSPLVCSLVWCLPVEILKRIHMWCMYQWTFQQIFRLHWHNWRLVLRGPCSFCFPSPLFWIQHFWSSLAESLRPCFVAFTNHSTALWLFVSVSFSSASLR